MRQGSRRTAQVRTKVDTPITACRAQTYMRKPHTAGQERERQMEHTTTAANTTVEEAMSCDCRSQRTVNGNEMSQAIPTGSASVKGPTT
eukprot:NODE_27410_length_515_cov_1.069588.p2 GENE.NODE_27410_length_515_cov_1.069588~~NODE_27410_length_515_cov_1.069588.p2  ORF type:complete len:89 (+),score=1.99 NODE_27410_length_515_cov_1.069588:34-300(+)